MLLFIKPKLRKALKYYIQIRVEKYSAGKTCTSETPRTIKTAIFVYYYTSVKDSAD